MRALFLLLGLLLAACGGGSSSAPPLPPPPPSPVSLPGEPIVAVEAFPKQLTFSWQGIAGATYYRLLENPDGHSGFTQIGADIPSGTLSFTREISAHLLDWVNALYIVEACNASGCSSSDAASATDVMLDTIDYLKASNTGVADQFGHSLALSGDGSTLAVGARLEDSAATGVNGDQSDELAVDSGAVYVFRLEDNAWRQEAYLKASNAESGDQFGSAVALNGDGNILIVGAPFEDSNASGLDGDEADNSASDAGAAYVFSFDGIEWRQDHYIKASVTDVYDDLAGNLFGMAVALDPSARFIAVGATREESSGRGVNSCPCDSWAQYSGAVYLFERNSPTWEHRAFIKGSTAEDTQFGRPIVFSSDGNTLAIAEYHHWAYRGGDVFVYRFDGTQWHEEAEITGSNSRDTQSGEDEFGFAISLNADGTSMAIGAPDEGSASTVINGDQNDNSRRGAGAVYLFRFDGLEWEQQAYFKPSTVSGGQPSQFSEASFGTAVALDSVGNSLAVGAPGVNSGDSGVDADQDDYSAEAAGAAFLFEFDGTAWSQTSFIKASNSDEGDRFGSSLQMSNDGELLVVGAPREDGAGTGTGSNQADNSAGDSGAVYIY